MVAHREGSLQCRAVRLAYESQLRLKDLERIAEHEVRFPTTVYH
jgi:hypothetical protein